MNKPKTFDIDELIRAMPLEERLYRFRCVEAWAMAVPWTGFSFAALIKHTSYRLRWLDRAQAEIRRRYDVSLAKLCRLFLHLPAVIVVE